MKAKEIVSKAIRFECPPRLPVQMDSLGVSDTRRFPLGRRALSVERGVDEWGCGWGHTRMKNMGQVKSHPLEDIRHLDRHPVPDYREDWRYEDAPAALERAAAEGSYVVCGIFMVLFERMHSLHGFENTLAGLYEDRPAMEALADRILETHLQLVQEVTRRFPGKVDAFSMTDDWGTQQAAFISAELWHDFFYPRYRRLFDAMHAAGCDVWVHSCGRVNEIIEGFIQAGAQVLNLQQPRALGIEEVGRRYAGRVSFSSLADIQATLPTGDRRRIEADVSALMKEWANPKGGFIFSDYGDGEAIGVPDDTKRWMYACFSRHSEVIYGEPLPSLPDTA